MHYFNNLITRFPLIGNRYFLAGLCFLVWILFFDKYSLISQYEDRNVLFGLKKEKQYYQDEIKNTSGDLRDLKNDKTLEKFAREKYMMKKENEEIWLVIPDTSFPSSLTYSDQE